MKKTLFLYYFWQVFNYNSWYLANTNELSPKIFTVK